MVLQKMQNHLFYIKEVIMLMIPLTATNTAVTALSIEERRFASVYKRMFGKKITAKIPTSKPVTPYI